MGWLQGGSKAQAMHHLRNLAMQLRKACNHPYALAALWHPGVTTHSCPQHSPACCHRLSGTAAYFCSRCIAVCTCRNAPTLFACDNSSMHLEVVKQGSARLMPHSQAVLVQLCVQDQAYQPLPGDTRSCPALNALVAREYPADRKLGSQKPGPTTCEQQGVLQCVRLAGRYLFLTAKHNHVPADDEELVRASGKLQLLDSILPKLQATGAP